MKFHCPIKTLEWPIPHPMPSCFDIVLGIIDHFGTILGIR